MKNKKKLGIIGGMGSRAGAFFLQKIIDYSPADTDQEFLDILFHNNSAVPDRTRAIVHGEQSPMEELYRSLEIFNDNQAEIIAIACVTSYHYYHEIAKYAKGLVLNPVSLVARHIRMSYPNTTRVGLLATSGTINSGLFQKELGRYGIEVVTLEDKEQEIFMRSVYMKNGFKSSSISPEARLLMEVSFGTLKRYDVDVIIGGCTEVSLAFDSHKALFPYIDALDLLAEETVAVCYQPNEEILIAK